MLQRFSGPSHYKYVLLLLLLLLTVHTHIATLNVNLMFLGVWVLVFDVSSWQLDTRFHNILLLFIYIFQREEQNDKNCLPQH